MKRRIGVFYFPALLACMLLFPLSQAAAQDLYDVEMIVFANRDTHAIRAESWPANPGTPDFSKGRRLKTKDMLLAEKKQHAESLEATLEHESAINSLLVEEDTAIDQMGFVLLPKSQWGLSDVDNKLSKNSNYEVLLHTAWRQPITEATQAVYLQGGKDTASIPPLEGLVKLRKSKFLHADIDFVLAGEPQPFRFQQSRKMRSKELHYLDHPALGVLIRIIPVEAKKSP